MIKFSVAFISCLVIVNAISTTQINQKVKNRHRIQRETFLLWIVVLILCEAAALNFIRGQIEHIKNQYIFLKKLKTNFLFKFFLHHKRIIGFCYLNLNWVLANVGHSTYFHRLPISKNLTY